MKKFLFIFLTIFVFQVDCTAQKSKKSKFKVLVLYENGGHHLEFSKAAKPWLNKLAADSGFTIDYIENTAKINDAFLKQYKVFIQLDYPPYTWSEESMKAFEKYMNDGNGGWIGLHHATLLGEFDGYPMWKWFSDFMGGIRFENYIATFANAKVNIEDKSHPVTKGISPEFLIKKEEWYTYNKSPRANVHVLASVDETTYEPNSDIKMGDHPVVWTNDHFKSRNVYIFMGHSPELFENEAYTTLLRNSIFWAASKK
ncbi:type 1 glutamine amidotransferase [Flavobacterium sp. 2755]|uniref:ThuA domain-containing protein n=1 Tax=Flavobacterium sp. 2755 TaxID=2817765 RepID=UPI002865A294|nr:ThuA domain-containing protein [Flavobacterium sp. 2755]MDR6759990.1 type 1 glutamine amidotransferase [Flavobacterium sp. 2755]